MRIAPCTCRLAVDTLSLQVHKRGGSCEATSPPAVPPPPCNTALATNYNKHNVSTIKVKRVETQSPQPQLWYGAAHTYIPAVPGNGCDGFCQQGQVGRGPGGAAVLAHLLLLLQGLCALLLLLLVLLLGFCKPLPLLLLLLLLPRPPPPLLLLLLLLAPGCPWQV